METKGHDMITQEQLPKYFYKCVARFLMQRIYPPQHLIARYMNKTQAESWAPLLQAFMGEHSPERGITKRDVQLLAESWILDNGVALALADMDVTEALNKGRVPLWFMPRYSV